MRRSNPDYCPVFVIITKGIGRLSLKPNITKMCITSTTKARQVPNSVQCNTYFTTTVLKMFHFNPKFPKFQL